MLLIEALIVERLTRAKQLAAILVAALQLRCGRVGDEDRDVHLQLVRANNETRLCELYLVSGDDGRLGLMGLRLDLTLSPLRRRLTVFVLHLLGTRYECIKLALIPRQRNYFVCIRVTELPSIMTSMLGDS